MTSIVVGGLAVHGAISACGNVRPAAMDAQASDAPLAVDASAPTGTIIAFGGGMPPAGWLLCDGTAVSRTTYAALFAVTGVSFGGGDDSTTFNVPDLRGRFLRGVDHGAGRDPDAASRAPSNAGGPQGDVVGTLQADATAPPKTSFVTENTGNHTHSNGDFDRLLRHSGTGTESGTDGMDGGSEPDLVSSAALVAAGAHTHRLGGGFGAGGDKETRPRNVSVNYLIKQ